MSSAVITAEFPAAEGIARDAGRGLVEYWVRCCNEFLDTQRSNLIEREPSPPELASHIRNLKVMIRLTLLLQATVSDPDFPARDLIPTIAGKLLQLEESLALFENPMTDGEADALMVQHFSHAPRSGSAA